MTLKTICQECQTPNPPGGKFCSNCGARLPKSTSMLCPRCQTPNPSSNVYCDKCGARLVQEEAARPSSEAPVQEDLPTSAKMFSLPTRKPGDTGELTADNVMEWLRSGQIPLDPEAPEKPDTGKLPRLSDLTPEQRGKTADLPAWLVDSDNQEFLIEAPEDITTEHFFNLIRQIDDEERKKLSGILSDPAITGKSGKLPDWLQEFVQSVEEEKEVTPPPAAKPAAPPAADEADDLDWLNELGPLNTDILAQPVGGRGQELPGSDLPDWLDELEPPNTEMLSRPTRKTEEPLVDAILSGQGVPDWLAANDAPDTEGLAQPLAESEPEEPLEDEEAYPDWLISPPDTSELELPTGPLPALDAAQEDISAQKAVSDWLTDFAEAEEEVPVADDAFAAEEADVAPAETAVSPAKEEKVRKSLTDWLTELDAIPPETPETPAETELTGWLTADDDGAAADDEEALGFGMTGPLPDWLDELEPSEEAPPAEQTYVSGMLDDILGLPEFADRLETAVPIPEEPVSTEAQEADFEPEALEEEPDWLAELAAFDPNELVANELVASEWTAEETAVAPPASIIIDEPFDEPFDLAEAEPAETVAPPEIAGDEEWADLEQILTGAGEEDELADWLEQLGAPTDAAFASDFALGDEAEEAEEPLISTGELPEWIASMRPGEAGQQDSLLPSVLPEEREDLYAIADDLAGADLPDWLQDVEGAKPEKTAVPLASAALPVWIDTESELGEPSSELESILADLPPALPPEEMLLKAEIPDWILNLKPKEMVGQPVSDFDFKLETTGPLAGMPGVIKVEPIVAMPRAISPAAPFAITKEQQQQASLLRQLVQEEQQPISSADALAAPKGRSGLRFLLALLLLAAVALALFVPNLLGSNPPTAVPPAADAVYTAVNAAAGQPVLVAFEYTPAMAGELDHEARLLLSQLQANGSPIVTISQSAAGTAVAQTLTQSLDEAPITLGMVAGEAIGLRQLANCLGDARITCNTLQGRSLSDQAQAALQNTALILVLTGERSSLINWTEQVGATSDIPLAAGVTQSLGPVAAPYYASGQLQGYIDGLPAVVALVNVHGSAADMAPAQQQYGAQSLVQLAAAVLLAAGALIMATARKKPAAQGQ